jgi:hypothetical protein
VEELPSPSHSSRVTQLLTLDHVRATAITVPFRFWCLSQHFGFFPCAVAMDSLSTLGYGTIGNSSLTRPSSSESLNSWMFGDFLSRNTLFGRQSAQIYPSMYRILYEASRPAFSTTCAYTYTNNIARKLRRGVSVQ